MASLDPLPLPGNIEQPYILQTGRRFQRTRRVQLSEFLNGENLEPATALGFLADNPKPSTAPRFLPVPTRLRNSAKTIQSDAPPPIRNPAKRRPGTEQSGGETTYLLVT